MTTKDKIIFYGRNLHLKAYSREKQAEIAKLKGIPENRRYFETRKAGRNQFPAKLSNIIDHIRSDETILIYDWVCLAPDLDKLIKFRNAILDRCLSLDVWLAHNYEGKDACEMFVNAIPTFRKLVAQNKAAQMNTPRRKEQRSQTRRNIKINEIRAQDIAYQYAQGKKVSSIIKESGLSSTTVYRDIDKYLAWMDAGRVKHPVITREDFERLYKIRKEHVEELKSKYII